MPPRTRQSRTTVSSVPDVDRTQAVINDSQIRGHMHTESVVQDKIVSQTVRETVPTGSANRSGRKRTLQPEVITPTSTTQVAISMDPLLGTPIKRPHHDNTAQHRPMQLDLESASGVESHQQGFDRPTAVVNSKTVESGNEDSSEEVLTPANEESSDEDNGGAKSVSTDVANAAVANASVATLEMAAAADKGKQPELQPASLNSDHHHDSLSNSVDPEETEDHEDIITVGGDSDVDTITDWYDEGEHSQKPPAKLKEVIKIERASWKGSSVADPSSSMREQLDNKHAMRDTVPKPKEGPSSWPTDTNLLRLQGSNQLALSAQVQLVWFVIQDAIDLLHASLVFGNAFPKNSVASALIREALLVSAEGYKLASFHIHQRLTLDSNYMSEMTILPRARISLIRRDVKERCISVVMPVFLAMGSPDEIAEMAKGDLVDYNYIYPKKPNTNGAMCSRPYRNPRILSIIRDLYFSGWSPFANKFQNRFPVYLHEDGQTRLEVPAAMVALVATGMYAAIDEWTTGQRRPMEFSAQAYLEVYQENMGLLMRIRDQRNPYFHRMMSEIYSNVSSDSMADGISTKGPGGHIELNLDNLED